MGGVLNPPCALAALEHFVDFFTGPKFFPLLRNTVVLGFYSVAFEFPAAILFAVCLYEVQNTVYRKFAQTISFLPHFISTVSVVAMMVMLFSPSNGYVNWLLNSIGIEPIYFMAEPGWFRPLYVGSSIWAGIGWGAIVYLAAMFGIPASLYESAAIDGATRWQNICSITGLRESFRTYDWGGPIYDQDVGAVVFGPATDKYRDLLKYLATLYQEGLMEKEAGTITLEQWEARVATNQSFIAGGWLSWAGFFDQLQRSAYPDAK